MKSLVAAVLLGIVCAANAATCPHTCSRQERYTTACGMFGWSRCSRYRTVEYACEQTCYHGGWTEWTMLDEGACSEACGGGRVTVTNGRSCTNPAPYNGGSDCQGAATKQEEIDCNTQPCPIDGGWSGFSQSAVTSCTASCGSGSQNVTLTRTCSAPSPQHGGHDCQGEATQTRQQACNTQPCPIDGGWSSFTAWTDYDECSALCGTGSKAQWRSRACDNPPPAYGGLDCQGDSFQNQTVHCNKKKCGSKCPPGTVTFIPNSDTQGRYYICDNGVARLQQCSEDTRWDQNSTACVHAKKQETVAVTADTMCEPGQAYLPHTDCTKFYMCVFGAAREMTCPPGTRFNVDLTACDLEANVPCDNA